MSTSSQLFEFFISLILTVLLVHFFEKIYLLLTEEKTGVVTFEAVNSDSDPDPDPDPEPEGKMLGIFKEKLVNPPEELNSPASLNASTKAKHPNDILKDFMTYNSTNAFSLNFGDAAFLAYAPSNMPSIQHRLFCGIEDIYCVFLGSLNNLSNLLKQYGLSKGTNEAMFIIEAYRTLRDRGPFPADQVIKELEGSYGFVIYDNKERTVFVALGANGKIGLFWGIAADGSIVISENLELIKASCAKSFASFPTGCMFHSVHGLMSYEYPTRKMKAMQRVDSEGVMCGANFKVDSQSKVPMMPRVGSEANWGTWGSQA
ncbi:hypothetical protein L6164_032833 [Bauhinia variegata]|uniref:Uncharacterized protein n=1 Tax=Bauhinia variegata TaxID=167791 RepID=A0ACB9KPY4_BAUVA|nr:hypothetical protein L6164_032833 [Bauhinia variegata]